MSSKSTATPENALTPEEIDTRPRVTILVDEDLRPQQGLAAGAWSIECHGIAELSKDDALIRDVTHRTLVKAMGAADAAQYTEPVMAEGRTIVTITPRTRYTWDYNKVD